MIKIFDGPSVDNIVHQAITKILKDGRENSSRNGDVKFITDAEFILRDPRQRHLNLKGRTSNIFQLIAETLWVVAGKDELYPYLVHFLPRAPLYSDDGRTWRGAYGKRIYKHGQLQAVVDAFVKDGLDTRRATVAIHNPVIDAPMYINGGTRDTPCNLIMSFYIDDDGDFSARTIQRSGDVIFGAGSINLFEFSFIQEMMHNIISQAMGAKFPDLGSYRHSTINLHLYSPHFEQAEKIAGYPGTSPVNTRQKGMIFPETVDLTRKMMATFIDDICCPLLAGKFNFGYTRGELFKLFEKYELLQLTSGNLLFGYMTIVLAYIASTRKYDPQEGLSIEDIGRDLPVDLYNALTNSSFRKFKI